MRKLETTYYLGYGANRDPEMMEAIIGSKPKSLGSIAIIGMELVVQKLSQITDDILPTSPIPQSPRQIIDSAWGKDSGFEAYGIRKDPNSSVDTTLYEITPRKRKLILEWKLVPYGWYDETTIPVELPDDSLVHAKTEAFLRGQEVDRGVDG